MKGKKPTYNQRKYLEEANKDTYSYLVTRDTSEEIVFVHRETQEKVIIKK